MVDEEETTTLSQNVRTDYAVIQVHIPESRNLQWQLASRWDLLQIACQFSTSLSPKTRRSLGIRLGLQGDRYISSQPQDHKQSQVWCSDFHLCAYWKQPVTCWLQPLNTDFFLCWDTSLGVTVVQMPKCLWGLHVPSATPVPCIYIEVRTKLSSATVCYLIFFKPFCIQNRM